LKKQTIKKILLLVTLAGFIVSYFPSEPVLVFSQTAPDKNQLKQELEAIEKLIDEYEQELATTQAEKQTLANKVKQLRGEQTKIQLQIRSTNLRVDELSNQIGNTEDSIRIAAEKIDELKDHTSELLRALYESDQVSMIELFLTSDSLPDAFGKATALETLSEEVLKRASQMKDAKTDLVEHQDQLEAQQDEAENLLHMQTLQEAEFRSKVNEQNEVLSVTKGVEAQYQAMLNESRQKASQIRMRLYDVAGGATTQVTFGQAVEIAKTVSEQTGVRAAFLLAILTQESNLGKNVGTCNRPGDPESKSWKNVMHPTRDLPKFEAIVKELGLDPDTTPVSCPMMRNGKRVGWGGAMGPAQFIPSTWVGYKDKVAAITGRPANPWDIRDAFLAAGLLLKSGGATKDGRQGEWNAAMRYFSGSTNPQYRFYGDNVLKTADKYQAEIDALSGK
jgi:peptidoglycan hydrolase CwlO-like protein